MYESIGLELEKIRTAEMHDDPYTYIEIENFFPANVYKDLIGHLPSRDKMAKSKDSHSRQIDIVRDPGVKRAANGEWEYQNHLDEDDCLFWDWFKERYFEGDFVQALRDKFDVPKDTKAYACGRIASEGQGSGLGPHSDRADKIISAVFYLDSDPLACGTILLRPKDKNFKPEVRHYGYKDFDIVKTIDYEQNKLIAWRVVPSSFHAYYQEHDTFRRTIKFFIQSQENPSVVQARIEETKKYADEWKDDIK